MFFRHLGVVGIDATLNSLEAVLRSEMWGNAYAFLTDEEGNAVLHPFIKPSAEVCVITGRDTQYILYTALIWSGKDFALQPWWRVLVLL